MVLLKDQGAKKKTAGGRVQRGSDQERGRGTWEKMVSRKRLVPYEWSHRPRERLRNEGGWSGKRKKERPVEENIKK